jgi:hypothetical protein
MKIKILIKKFDKHQGKGSVESQILCLDFNLHIKEIKTT